MPYKFKAGARFLCLWLAVAAAASSQGRVVESLLPSLAYSAKCSSTVELQNLADRPVTVDIEGHRSTGALVPLIGSSGMAIHLNPGERGSYRLQIEEETIGAWIKVRERIPSPGLNAAVAVSGRTECVIGDEVRRTAREVAYTMRNPWFSGNVAEIGGTLISVVNTSELAAKAWVCYSAGVLYSVPNEARPTPELIPVCSMTSAVQIPPFGTLEFAVERNGSSQFSLRTQGDAIVLQMLRPVDASIRMYKVDSTIRFGEEARPGLAK
jgi:hypothetical protein